MTFSIVNEIQKPLIERGIVMAKEFMGLTQDQIEELKKAQNVSQLPSVYEQFLLTMGRGAGVYIPDPDFFYPTILTYKTELVEILKLINWPLELADDAFVFYLHDLGHEAFFFYTGDSSDDPPVYAFEERHKGIFKLKHGSLSEYYLWLLEWAKGFRPR